MSTTSKSATATATASSSRAQSAFLTRAASISAARYVAAHDTDYSGAVKAARLDLQWEDALTVDGKGIVRKGALASNAFGSTRGAAAAINAALVKAGHKGILVSDLLDVVTAALPAVAVKTSCSAALHDRAVAKVVEHLRGMWAESDMLRAQTSGLAALVVANGHVLSCGSDGRTSIPAICFDGIAWNGIKAKAILGLSERISSPLLCAMHKKAAAKK